MLTIAFLALGWQLSVIGISRLFKVRSGNFSFKRLLKLVEIDLLKELRKNLDKLPDQKAEEDPYKKWSREVECRIRRIKKK